MDKIELSHWDELAKFGQNKLFRSSYYWLLLVPILVKLIERVENPIKVVLGQTPLEFNLNLPFSWKLFYLGAVLVTIGNIIYEFFCPEVNKKFINYSDFKTKGYTFTYLLKYKENIADSIAEKLNSLNVYFQVGNSEMFRDYEGAYTAESFWAIFNSFKVKRDVARFFCLLSYFIGLLFIAIVLVQNIIYVFQKIF